MALNRLSDRRVLRPRHVFALVVVGLHVGGGYVAAHWKSTVARSTELEPLQVSLSSEPLPVEPEKRPPPPPVARVALSVEMPVITLPDVPQPVDAIAVAPPSTPVAAPVASPVIAAASPRTVSTVDYVRAPAVRYPSASRRLREEGLVVLRVLIDAQGHASQVELHRSSGFERLDNAAREAVLAALFKPCVEDGVAQPAFALVPIEFSLNQRVAQR